MKGKFYILWSSLGIASAVVSALIAYTTFYATDVLQLNAGLVGTLLLVSKLFDGVTDLVAGFLVDRTNTKLGRARPYDITYALFALFTLFLFNTPRMGKTLMAVYVFVMYTLIFSVFQTLYSCASTVYLSRVIETDENRVKVNSISSVISAVIAIIVGIALPLLIEAVGTSHEKWGQMAIYICAPCVVLALVRLFTIKETSTRGIAASTTINLKEGVYLLFHNKYVLIYALALLLTNIATNFGSATTYYFKYIVQNLGLMSLVQIGGIAGPVAIARLSSAHKETGNEKADDRRTRHWRDRENSSALRKNQYCASDDLLCPFHGLLYAPFRFGAQCLNELHGLR